MMIKKFYFLFLLISFPWILKAQKMDGDWILLNDSSTSVMYFSGCKLSITTSNENVKTIWKWLNKFAHTDSLELPKSKKNYNYLIKNRVWPYENFMGVNYDTSSIGVARLLSFNNSSMKISDKYKVKIAQGITEMVSTYDYSLSPDGTFLTVTVQRQSRDVPARYVFRRDRHINVYSYALPDKWGLKNGVEENTLLISLQGLANRKQAQLYFIYPDGWEYRFTSPMKTFYENNLGYTFTPLRSQQDVLKHFYSYAKGYIIWDTTSRSSLCVAFTLAGLKDAVVVAPSQVKMVKELGLNCIEDFTGKFKGMNDNEVFHWAYEHYWNECNKDFLLWMGGADGDYIMPAIADFGIANKTFFADLSTDPKDKEEYAFADTLMKKMNPLALVVGWHSYSKDLERNYVTLASKHGLRIEGLHTFPNLSFTSKTPPSPGFTFKNNHSIKEGKKLIAKKDKVYITCVQTDGLGLGAWTKPGRGSIPYAWEVTINWAWMAPVMLEYYYKGATKNDYFFGSLSGPGYMYPKAIPDSLFSPLMHITDSLCKKLDLNVFETMDYSEGSSATGNNDLPKHIVEKYFKAMPNIIGMLNGYAPSYTFGLVNKKPFISYDYYLDEKISEELAATDLKELIKLNNKKPYFLALHVREWNDIDRVKRIIDRLGNNVEIVSLDTFLQLAASDWTFKEYYLKK